MATKPLLNSLFELVGLGVAFGSVLWVLAHLVMFSIIGEVRVGEPNPVILYGEISLVTFGLVAFVKRLLRQTGRLLPAHRRSLD